MKFLHGLGIFFALAISVNAFAGPFDVINPIGEEKLGYLLVDEPTWGSQTEKEIFDYQLRYRNKAVKPEFKSRFVAGKGCISVTSSQINGTHSVCDVVIEKGKTTKKVMAGLVVNWDTSDSSPLNVDFGQKPAINVWLGKNQFSRTQPFWNGTNERGLLTVPGTYKFGFNIKVLEPVEHTLVEGKVHRLDVTPRDRRARIVVKQGKKVFPNPTPQKCEAKVPQFLLEKNKEVNGLWEPHVRDVNTYGKASSNSNRHGITAFYAWAGDSDFEARVFPYTEGEAKYYAYVVNNIPIELNVEPEKTTEVTLKRIDINDVKVTTETGETKYVRGTYTVTRKNLKTQSWQQVQRLTSNYSDCSGYAKTSGRYQFPTKTGLDVPAGEYKIQVTYNTAEGVKTLNYDMDLRD